MSDTSPERVSPDLNHPVHSHQFTPVWQSDCTLIGWCKCGEKRSCELHELRESLHHCISLRTEYLLERDKCSSKARQQEFARAVAVKDRQIAWLEPQIEGLSLPNSGESSASTPKYLALDEIRKDGGTQPRAAIDLKHVKLLEEQMEDGKELEPVTVFYDGESYWLADGYHRWHAHRNQRKEAIACVIHQGSCRDAVLYSVGANADHKPALPRSREDKRRAVMTLLHDPEWSKWSDREIAQRCKVHHNTVGKIRASLTGDLSSEPRTYITKHGTVAKMNTANIGKKSQKAIPQFESDWSDDNVQRHPPLPSRVTVTDDHPLFPGQSGTITQMPNVDSAIVELDTGERELINLKHLKPTVAPKLQLNEGGLVEVYAPGNNGVDGRRGRIAAVHERTVEVWLRDVDTMAMMKYALKHQQVTPLPLEKEPQLKEICDHLTKLRECDLDPFEVEILNLLERTVVLTPTELEYLTHIEQRHGITSGLKLA